MERTNTAPVKSEAAEKREKKISGGEKTMKRFGTIS